MTTNKSIVKVTRPDAPDPPPTCGGVPVPGQIGFIGLGHMGTAMATNLAAAGHQVVAYVRRPDQLDRLATLGLTPTTEFGSLFDCGIVITMLPDDVAVRRGRAWARRPRRSWSRRRTGARRGSSFHEHNKHLRRV